MASNEEQEAVKLARDLCTETLHGAPPVATTMRIAAALVAMSEQLHQARKERDESQRLVEALAGGLTVASEVGEPAERMLRETLAIIIHDADALGIVDELEGKRLPEMVADLISTIRQMSQGIVNVSKERDEARKLAVQLNELVDHYADAAGRSAFETYWAELPEDCDELVAAWAEEGG